MRHHRDMMQHILFLACSLCLFAASFTQGAALTTEKIAGGFTRPIFLTAPPGDTTRIIVVQQTGLARLIKNGVLQATPFLDLTGKLSPGFEQGFLCMAFHPLYPDSNYIYVNYTNIVGALVIARFEVTDLSLDFADASSEEILLTIAEPESNHNGGTIFFGPNDGYLYVSLGDGGGGGDQHGTIGNGQSLTTLLGKIIRIDINHGLPYAIPADNPFVGTASALDEIWAYGLRNPWRVGLDQSNGDLYIADVGQSSWEELNYQPGMSTGGENYGWRLMEGAHCYNPSTGCDPGGLTYPLTEYSSSLGCSIIAGFVYRGCRIPDLDGTFFYADWCTASIWSLKVVGGIVTDSTNRTTELDPPGADQINQPSSFGLDAAGELYIIDHGDGEVYKIVPADSTLPSCDQADCCQVPGDANGDSAVNIGDAVFLINHIFNAGAGPQCPDEGDANADCALNIGDAVFLINYIFRGGDAPACPVC
ncbi:MAG: PQQ-dependent sugar dehydrogenase [Candidatus Zixiibacteriota bacterium]